jgi:hypothetical protein
VFFETNKKIIMNKKINIPALAIAGLLFLTLIGCDKNKPYDVIEAPGQVHFTATSRNQSYYVENSPTNTYSVEVGTTDVSNTDRTVGFKVTSPTGAVSGTHYSLVTTNNTITIPAGQSKASIVVHGIFAPYSAGTRQDVLQFTLTEPSVTVAGFSDTINLTLQRYCPVDLAAFTGNYVCQDYYNGAPDGGPYTVTLTPGTSTGTNTGFVTLNRLWGYTNPSVRINLNWNNPANFITTVERANWFVHSTYGQSVINPAGNGTFSSCDNTFTIAYEATVAAGSFGRYLSTLRK